MGKIEKLIKIIRINLRLATMVLGVWGGFALKADATGIREIENRITQHESELQNWNNQIAHLEDEQDLLEEQIADLNAEIVNTMTSIGLKEEEIAEKEIEISEKKVQIQEKEVQIGETEREYLEAVEREEKQREAMIEVTRMIYEHDQVSYLGSIIRGKGLAEILNQLDYVERVYEYSVNRLKRFIDTKNQVHNLWERLEREKAELVQDQEVLERDRESLEADKAELDGLRSQLNIRLGQKKKESANFDAEIKKAKQQAAVAQKLIQQERAELKRLQNAQSAGNAANQSYTTTNYTSVIDGAVGSDLGKKVAKYGCQFIGNPYVMGGTSLTNGADCSGFTYRIYRDFGYNIPRTSFQQRSAGTGVEYDNAQPGDLICYDGHVGLYIGGGMIVHASNEKTGIKVSRAQYRVILAVRRII